MGYDVDCNQFNRYPLKLDIFVYRLDVLGIVLHQTCSAIEHNSSDNNITDVYPYAIYIYIYAS